ncbi:MAG: hypothetical protein US20_C0030G0001, partial [Candidatus Pacebacteria bacterium GW2011_GWF1_36_5]
NPLFEKIAKENNYFGISKEELFQKVNDNHKTLVGIPEIPKKINLKKASIFQKPSKSGDLASVLKNLDGGTAPIKPRNKKATKAKKTKNRKKK